MVAFAQETTGDPLLDAILEEEKTQTMAADAAKAADAASAPKVDPRQVAVEMAAKTDPRLQGRRQLEDALVSDTGVLSNENVYDGRRISKVSVRYLDKTKTIPDQRLYDVISTRAGSNYSSSRVNSDLERLIDRGLVAPDTRVAVEQSSGGLTVIFEVSSANILGGVGFAGNYRFDENDLRETSKLRSGRVINDRSLAEARAAIIKDYQDARYPDVKVNWRQIGTQRAAYRDIIFDIQEGDKVEMKDIEFVGNKHFDRQQLRQVMGTKKKDFLSILNKSGVVDREKLEDDKDAILAHYRNFGYLRARITNVWFEDKGKPGHQKLRMVVSLDEGPRYRVRSISFDGIKAYSQPQLEPGLSMIDGDIYSLKKVGDDVTMIRKYYGAKGYADAAVRPDVSEVGVDAQGMHLIDIRYEVTEGHPYRVGRVNLRGNTRTQANVILRELPLKSGDNLNAVDLETAKKRLMNLGYFSGVEVSQSSSATSGYRDININVGEKMTGSVTFGLAFSTVESVYLYTTITQSNFNIAGFTGGSFTGGGQRLTLSAKLGGEYQSGSIYLLEPWFLDKKLAFGNELFFSSSDYLSDYYTQVNYGVATSLRKAISDKSSVKIEYRLEQYNIEATSDASVYFTENDGDYTRSRVELSYDYDTRDAMNTPREGGLFDVTLGYSGPGSTEQTFGLAVSGSYYYNSIWDSIFSVSVGAETIDTVDKDAQVPLFEKLYLGGPNNLRGFRYRDVGMVNEDLAADETMGGKSSFYAQFEASLPIVETVRFAFFVDAGFVHAESADFSPGEWAADYGIGLRVNLPMGPLAVDYAIPFKTENAIDDGGQFQFYVNYKY